MSVLAAYAAGRRKNRKTLDSLPLVRGSLGQSENKRWKTAVPENRHQTMSGLGACPDPTPRGLPHRWRGGTPIFDRPENAAPTNMIGNHRFGMSVQRFAYRNKQAFV